MLFIEFQSIGMKNVFGVRKIFLTFITFIFCNFPLNHTRNRSYLQDIWHTVHKNTQYTYLRQHVHIYNNKGVFQNKYDRNTWKVTCIMEDKSIYLWDACCCHSNVFFLRVLLRVLKNLLSVCTVSDSYISQGKTKF